jgi:hypothetical protein
LALGEYHIPIALVCDLYRDFRMVESGRTFGFFFVGFFVCHFVILNIPLVHISHVQRGGILNWHIS